jgi:hypothetical protein
VDGLSKAAGLPPRDSHSAGDDVARAVKILTWWVGILNTIPTRTP